MFKLRQNHIYGKRLEWLNTNLSQRKHINWFKSCYSGLKSISTGVPQGSVLGPLLFLGNSYTMGCPPVRGENPRALASGLSYVQVDKHGITILCHQH